MEKIFERCKKCEGSGLTEHEPIPCPHCDGKICYICQNRAGYVRSSMDTCEECDGTGSIENRTKRVTFIETVN